MFLCLKKEYDLHFWIFFLIIKSVISVSFRMNEPALLSPKRPKRFNKAEIKWFALD